MSRGDKRERDRAKSQAKLAKKNNSNKEGDPLQRNASDSAALAAKVAKKKAMLEEQEKAAVSASASASVVRKKVPKKADAGLDDLLNAGLSAGKKGKKK